METTHIVLLGAGHANVQVLKSFGDKPAPGIRLTLITPDTHTPYSGMLPGLIAGLYSFDDAHIDVRPLCAFANAQLHLGCATGIDQAAKAVICDNHVPIPYDILSIDTGATPNTGTVPGAAEYAIAVKPISRFLDRFEALRSRVMEAKDERRIAVVGGGAGGVELMLALERRLRGELSEAGRDRAQLGLTLVTASERILREFPMSFSERFKKILAKRRIGLMTGIPASRVERGHVQLSGVGRVLADEILWVTEAGAPGWLQSAGLPLSEKGFLQVDSHLRAKGMETIFGAGDVIAFGPRDLPKSGVYAVRAGPVLAENIRRLIAGEDLTTFEPQREALYLISTGDRFAIGTRNDFVFSGHWVWRWKDWIDRRFMARFKDLPI